jgi:hypothetical protein
VSSEPGAGHYIVACGVKRKWLLNKTFSKKMKKCKLLSADERNDPLWDVLDAANQLRNAIAHTLSVEKIGDKMTQLRKKYLASLAEQQAAGLKDEPDDYLALAACIDCAGFIATLKMRVESNEAEMSPA